jgi:hypothetical protein
MKRLSTHLLITLICFATLSLSHCDDNTIMEAEPLEGLIGGEAWKFKFAKANYNDIDNLFDAELYSTSQDTPSSDSDPCSVFITAEAHISMQVPDEMGNYQIPSDIQVIFNLPGVGNEFFSATSGFVELSAANSQQVVGYLQATFDDENTLEGAFSFTRCN